MMTDSERRAKQVQYQRKHQKKKLKAVRDYKEAKGCMDCGGKFPYYVLDLDHRDPSQKNEKLKQQLPSRRTGGGFYQRLSWAEIATELDKCDVVCSNCHRVRTHGNVTA